MKSAALYCVVREDQDRFSDSDKLWFEPAAALASYVQSTDGPASAGAGLTERVVGVFAYLGAEDGPSASFQPVEENNFTDAAATICEEPMLNSCVVTRNSQFGTDELDYRRDWWRALAIPTESAQIRHLLSEFEILSADTAPMTGVSESDMSIVSAPPGPPRDLI